jgi:hypothetical protein
MARFVPVILAQAKEPGEDYHHDKQRPKDNRQYSQQAFVGVGLNGFYIFPRITKSKSKSQQSKNVNGNVNPNHIPSFRL